MRKHEVDCQTVKKNAGVEKNKKQDDILNVRDGGKGKNQIPVFLMSSKTVLSTQKTRLVSIFIVYDHSGLEEALCLVIESSRSKPRP